MAQQQQPNNAIVVDGDIQRRLIKYLVPDFYLEDTQQWKTLRLLRTSLLVMDELLEKAKGLPDLVNVDLVSEDLLKNLAALLGYKWKDGVLASLQRQEIRKLVSVYQVRGSPQSVIRLVLTHGASLGDVFTPYERINFFDKSVLSGGDRFTDRWYWRWGTYDVISNIDFSKFHSDIQDVHPAGTLWYGSQLVQTEIVEDSGDELEDTTFVQHVVEDDYRVANSEHYQSQMLSNATLTGYWKLDEPPDAFPSLSNVIATYDTSLYDQDVYDLAASGIVAADSSGVAPTATYIRDGFYNSEDVSLESSVSGTTFGPYTIGTGGDNPRVLAGTVIVYSANQIILDDGLGNLIQVISGVTYNAGSINYTTGVISSIIFHTALSSATIKCFFNDYTVRGQAGALFTPSTSTAFGLQALNRSCIYIGDQVSGTDPTIVPLGNLSNSNTVSFWMKTSASGVGSLFSMNYSGNDISLSFAPQGSLKLSITYPAGSISFNMTGSKYVKDNTWHHVAVVLDRTLKMCFLYVDGTLDIKQSVDISAVLFSPGTTRFLFGAQTSTTNFFTGNLDEIATFSSALSAQEIQYNYFLGSGLTALENSSTLPLIGNHEDLSTIVTSGFILGVSYLGETNSHFLGAPATGSLFRDNPNGNPNQVTAWWLERPTMVVDLIYSSEVLTTQQNSNPKKVYLAIVDRSRAIDSVAISRAVVVGPDAVKISDSVSALRSFLSTVSNTVTISDSKIIDAGRKKKDTSFVYDLVLYSTNRLIKINEHVSAVDQVTVTIS